MSATPITALPLGPLDLERSELLMRVVDGLDGRFGAPVEGLAGLLDLLARHAADALADGFVRLQLE